MMVISLIVFGGSIIGIAALIHWDKMQEADLTFQRLSELYLRSLRCQEMLGRGFDNHDDIYFASAYEQLEAFLEDAFKILGVPDDGSDEAEIVRDMFYAYVTPEETMQRLEDLRLVKQRHSPKSPVCRRWAYERR